jgi:hypothetical protein
VIDTVGAMPPDTLHGRNIFTAWLGEHSAAAARRRFGAANIATYDTPDHVDPVPAPQTMVGDPQQGVGVRRQINPDDIGLFVHDMIDEAGILVAEAVVILAPDMRGEKKKGRAMQRNRRGSYARPTIYGYTHSEIQTRAPDQAPTARRAASARGC